MTTQTPTTRFVNLHAYRAFLVVATRSLIVARQFMPKEILNQQMNDAVDAMRALLVAAAAPIPFADIEDQAVKLHAACTRRAVRRALSQEADDAIANMQASLAADADPLADL